MKKLYPIVSALFAGSLFLTSCLGDETVYTDPECSITSFSVADITSTITEQKPDGTDSSYTKTISGDYIYFNINQLTNEISTVDSLPYWADVTHVVPTVSSDGVVYYKHKGEEMYSYFNNGTDSIDFTDPVEFLVVAFNANDTKRYTVSINKSSADIDSLVWTRVVGSDLSLNGVHHPLFHDGRIYIFSENGGRPVVTSTSLLSEGRSWRAEAEMSGADGTIDFNSVVSFKGNMYALDSEGGIYESTGDLRGETWVLASEKKLKKILAVDSNYLYGFDGTSIVATTDLLNWTENGNTDLDCLPDEGISYASYATKTNPSLENVVFLGNSSGVSGKGAVWFKISSANEANNETWNYIQVTDDNPYPCPKLENLQMVRYNGALYAFGGKPLDGTLVQLPYDYFFCSNDNGITWHKVLEKVALPSQVRRQDVPLSIVKVDSELWLFQSGGNIWRGRISNLSE